MQFDTGDFCTSEFHHIIYMVDVVIFDHAEDTSHASDDAALLAVVYVVAAYDVPAYVLFEPSVILPAADGIPLHLSRTFYIFRSKVVVVVRVIISPERDACALAVDYLTVLYYPALAPVRTYHAVLESCRRRPGRSCFLHPEASDSDIVPARFRRPEAFSPDVDLNFFEVRIHSLKVRIDHGLVAFFVLLRKPFVLRILRIPADFAELSADAFFKTCSLIHCLIVQIHAARMLIRLGKIPVAIHECRVRIVVSEQAVIYPRDPYSV